MNMNISIKMLAARQVIFSSSIPVKVIKISFAQAMFVSFEKL